MQAGPDDHQKPYRMTTEVVEVDGSSRVLVDATVAVEAHSGENRFWVTPFGMAGKTSGRRVLVQTIEGGGSIALPVEVRVVERGPSRQTLIPLCPLLSPDINLWPPARPPR